jgi:hypothetical protein
MTNLNFRFEYALLLLLISKVKIFRSSYDLAKVLAWKFDIINFVELSNEITRDRLVNKTIENALNYYSITTEGVDYLYFWKEKFLPVLFEKYPNEREFLEKLAALPDIQE